MDTQLKPSRFAVLKLNGDKFAEPLTPDERYREGCLTSGLTRKKVADDLGIDMSALSKRIAAHRDTGVVSKEDLCPVPKNDRLRRENRLLKKDRNILAQRQLSVSPISTA